jgi:hypothetical protein
MVTVGPEGDGQPTEKGQLPQTMLPKKRTDERIAPLRLPEQFDAHNGRLRPSATAMGERS